MIIFLIIITILLGVITYLLFRLLPVEERKKIARQITPTKGQVMDWEPPQEAEEKAFKKVLKKIGL